MNRFLEASSGTNTQPVQQPTWFEEWGLPALIIALVAVAVVLAIVYLSKQNKAAPMTSGQLISIVANLVIFGIATIVFLFCMGCAIEMIQLSALPERDFGQGLSFAILIIFYIIGAIVAWALSLVNAVWSGVVGFSKKKPIDGKVAWLLRVPFILDLVYAALLLVFFIVVLLLPKG